MEDTSLLLFSAQFSAKSWYFKSPFSQFQLILLTHSLEFLSLIDQSLCYLSAFQQGQSYLPLAKMSDSLKNLDIHHFNVFNYYLRNF
jgi:hypothetical protein